MNSDKMITKKTWKEYAESSDAGFFDYIDATNHMVAALDKILAQSQNFKELKGQLTELTNERKQFLRYTFNNYPK